MGEFREGIILLNPQNDYCMTQQERDDRRRKLETIRSEAERVLIGKIREWAKDAVQQQGGQQCWPTSVDMLCKIRESSEWEAYVVPQVALGNNLEGVMNLFIGDFSQFIREQWIEANVHECLAFDDCKKRLEEDSGKPEGWVLEEVAKQYYDVLAGKVYNTLYYENRVFKEDELRYMIPEIESPYWRPEAIRRRYLEHFSDPVRKTTI